MQFDVTFINQAGDEITDARNIWIGAELMSSIISFSQRNVKFVFDETINMKPGWRVRTILSQDPATMG